MNPPTLLFPVDPNPFLTPARALRSALVLGCFLHVVAAQAERDGWKTSTLVGSPEPPARYRAERVFPQFNFSAPVDLQAIPGENSYLLLQQDGKLIRFAADAATRATNVVLDIRAHHQPFDNALGFALHPKFASNRQLFVNYNEPGGATNGAHVDRFTVGMGDRPTIDWATRRPVITWMSGGHNGCQLLFGPDQMLYISTGDASPPDPPDVFRTGQGVNDLLSSILRIDPDHPSEGRPYGIPAGNPFVGMAGARPEVWALGFRNPWRMAFAPDGALWVGDVGWELWELLHRVTPGYNGGWAYVEGPNASVRNDVTPGPTAIHKPLLALPHSEAASITAGQFYRGSKFPELKGAHLFSDYETGKFWSVRADGDTVTEFRELCDTTLRPVSFAETPSGELIVVDYNGGLYELVRNEAPDLSARFPRKLSATGLFRDTAAQTPSTGVREYTLNHPMWADHATARQWLAIPGTSTAVWTDKWAYPTNTVFAKTLSLRMDAADAATERRIETQVLQFDGQTWRAYSYRWNEAQTDAELVPAEGATREWVVRDPQAPGLQRHQSWRFHSRTECLRCHNPWAGNAIGFSLEQLGVPGQVEALQSEQFIQLRERKNPLPRLASPANSNASGSELARAWLHVNCAHCHRFGAGGSVATFLNHEVNDLGTRTVDERPIRGGFGLEGARVIAHGDASRSTLFYRINTEGQGHMPHIGSRLVDERGARWVSQWIERVQASTNVPAADEASARAKADSNRAQSRAVLSGEGSSSKVDLAQLVASTSGALSLIEATLRSGNPPPPAVVQAAIQSPNPMVRDLFDRFLPPVQRRKVLGEVFNPQVVLSLKGDVDRGRILFHAEGGVSCSRCHALEGKGKAYGPDLAVSAKKYPVAELLDHIIHPSRQIQPEYVLHQVELRGGDVLSGFVVRRDVGGLVLRSEDLTEHTLKTADLQSDTPSALSAMPDGLLNGFTAQEAADVLAYLMNAAGKP